MYSAVTIWTELHTKSIARVDIGCGFSKARQWMYYIFNVPRLFIDYEMPQTLEQLAWVLSSSIPGHSRLATDDDYR